MVDKMKCYIHFCVDPANYNSEQNCRRQEEWGKEGLETEEKEKGTVRRYLLKMNRASQTQKEGDQPRSSGREVRTSLT